MPPVVMAQVVQAQPVYAQAQPVQAQPVQARPVQAVAVPVAADDDAPPPVCARVCLSVIEGQARAVTKVLDNQLRA